MKITAKIAILPLTIISLLNVTGCQTITDTTSKVGDKALSMVGLARADKTLEIDKKGIVDISKTTLEQIEKLKQNMPIGQWVYIENDLQGIYDLQNKAVDGHMLFLRLNCKNSVQKPSLSIQNVEGSEILNSLQPEVGTFQVLLDNKNYGNPFSLANQKNLATFQTAAQKAKTIKIFHSSKLYTFQNGKAELLNKPVTCMA